MSERDVDGLLMALREALDKDDEGVGREAAIQLVGGFLKNVSRIADALEVIATPAKD